MAPEEQTGQTREVGNGEGLEIQERRCFSYKDDDPGLPCHGDNVAIQSRQLVGILLRHLFDLLDIVLLAVAELGPRRGRRGPAVLLYHGRGHAGRAVSIRFEGVRWKSLRSGLGESIQVSGAWAIRVAFR